MYPQSKTLPEYGVDGWSVAYAEETYNELFSYYCPFPPDDRLVVMGSYVVELNSNWGRGHALSLLQR